MRTSLRSTLCTLFAPCLTALVFSQLDAPFGGIESAIPELEAEREEAVRFFNETVEEIEKQKLVLIRKTNALDQQIIEKKETLRDIELEATNKLAKRNAAMEQVEALKGQSSYIDGVLRDFTTNFLTRIDFTEYQKYLASITQINESTRLESVKHDEKIAAQLDAIELSIELLENAIGGYQFQGNALDSTGILVQGTITRIGPSSYFTSESTEQSGLLTPNVGTIEPKIVSISPQVDREIANVSRTATGLLPTDIVSSALKLNRERGNLIDHVKKGGWVGYVILLLGALSTLLVAAKFFSIKSENPKQPTDLDEIVAKGKTGDIKSAKELLATQSRSVRSLISYGLENLQESSELLEEYLLSNVLEYKLRLERFVPLLALTAATAPLLGLLGTVVGMIKTFTLITVFGTGDASSLSSGISEALVTTELGLIIAVPALIFHGLVVHMIQSRTATMERIAFEFVRETNRIQRKQ